MKKILSFIFLFALASSARAVTPIDGTGVSGMLRYTAKTYGSLPSASSVFVLDKYIVLTKSNSKPAGIYRSTGTAWILETEIPSTNISHALENSRKALSGTNYAIDKITLSSNVSYLTNFASVKAVSVVASLVISRYATNTIILSHFNSTSNRITAVSNVLRLSITTSTNSAGRVTALSNRLTSVSNHLFVSIVKSTQGNGLRFVSYSNRQTRISNMMSLKDSQLSNRISEATQGNGARFVSFSNRTTSVSNRFPSIILKLSALSNKTWAATNGNGARFIANSNRQTAISNSLYSYTAHQTNGNGLRFVVLSNRITSVSNLSRSLVVSSTLGSGKRFVSYSNRIGIVSNSIINYTKLLTNNNGQRFTYFSNRSTWISNETVLFLINWSRGYTSIYATNLIIQNGVTNQVSTPTNGLSSIFSSGWPILSFVPASISNKAFFDGDESTYGTSSFGSTLSARYLFGSPTIVNEYSLRIIATGPPTPPFYFTAIAYGSNAGVWKSLSTNTHSGNFNGTIKIAFVNTNKYYEYKIDLTGPSGGANLYEIRFYHWTPGREFTLKEYVKDATNILNSVLTNWSYKFSNKFGTNIVILSHFASLSNYMTSIIGVTNGSGQRFISYSNRMTAISNKVGNQTNNFGYRFLIVSNKTMSVSNYFENKYIGLYNYTRDSVIALSNGLTNFKNSLSNRMTLMSNVLQGQTNGMNLRFMTFSNRTADVSNALINHSLIFATNLVYFPKSTNQISTPTNNATILDSGSWTFTPSGPGNKDIFDGNYSTYGLVYNLSNKYITYQFSTPTIINYYHSVVEMVAGGYHWSKFTLSASNNLTWTTLASNTNNSAYVDKIFTNRIFFVNTNAYYKYKMKEYINTGIGIVFYELAYFQTKPVTSISLKTYINSTTNILGNNLRTEISRISNSSKWSSNASTNYVKSKVIKPNFIVDLTPFSLDIPPRSNANVTTSTLAYGYSEIAVFTNSSYLYGQFRLPPDLDTTGNVQLKMSGYNKNILTRSNWIAVSFQYSATTNGGQIDLSDYINLDSADSYIRGSNLLDEILWSDTITNVRWVSGGIVRFRIKRIVTGIKTNLLDYWNMTHFRIEVGRK